MIQSPTHKILKKRGRKPKNKNVDISNTVIEEPVDSDKEVIIAYLPININDINEIKHTQSDEENENIFINSESYYNKSENDEIKPSFGKYFSKINIYQMIFTINTKCWWCKNCFNTPKISLPEQYFNESFYCIGNFCSYNCVKAYNIDLNDSFIWKRESLINFMYYLTFGCFKNINPAPSWLILKDFGGIVDIDNFRKNFEVNNLEFLVLEPPIISRQMQIEESYKKNQSQYVSVNKLDKIFLDSDNNLLLKRNKPIETSQLNLETSMGLKRKTKL
jgi:hypothetical protein